MHRPIAMVVIAVLLAASAGATEVFVYTLAAPQVWESYPIDFGVAFTEIVSVEVTAVGVGGLQYGYCSYPGGTQYLELPLDLGVFLESPAVASRWLDLPDGLTPFDVSAALELEGGQPDWAFLEDGRTTLYLRTEDWYEFDMHWCYPTGFDVPVIDTMTFRITADTVVPTQGQTWSTVKALYD
jgi:hypothetical protein